MASILSWPFHLHISLRRHKVANHKLNALSPKIVLGWHFVIVVIMLHDGGRRAIAKDHSDGVENDEPPPEAKAGLLTVIFLFTVLFTMFASMSMLAEMNLKHSRHRRVHHPCIWMMMYLHFERCYATRSAAPHLHAKSFNPITRR